MCAVFLVTCFMLVVVKCGIYMYIHPTYKPLKDMAYVTNVHVVGMFLYDTYTAETCKVDAAIKCFFCNNMHQYWVYMPI